MPKVLFISNISRETVSSFSKASIAAAIELGYEFYSAANWNKASLEQRASEEKKHHIKIRHIDFRRNPFHPANFKAYRQLLELMKQERFDIVHCNTPVGGLLGRICAKKCQVKHIIYQVHGFHFYKGAPLLNWLVYYPIEKLLARITDTLITINEEDFHKARNFKLRKGGNVKKINGVGIELNYYSHIEPIREKINQDLNVSNCDKLLISVGELNANKNNKVVLQALSKLGNKNIHYLLCGVGNKKENLEALAEKLGISKQVHFLGYCNNIPELLKASDIFVMPSYREGLSRSIMEAMAVGLPCIVSDIRGNRDLIQNGKGGYLANPSDVDGFVSAIKSLANDVPLGLNMGAFNTEQIKQYEFKSIRDAIKTIYRGACE